MRGFLASARRVVSLGAVAAAVAAVVVATPQDAWAAPANDNFANATDLGATGSGQVTGTNSGATLETGEPNHFVIGSYAQMSVWWRWTAPSTGWYAFNVDLSSPATFHPVVEVYDGTSVNALTRANPNASGYTTTVGINAAAGHEYHVVVASDGSSGDIVLRWATQPANDDFADAAPLSGPSGTVTGTTIAATAETGEPQHFNDGSGSNHYTVWYSWVAPEDGTVTFDTAGSERAQVAVYSGDSLGALTLLGAQSIAAAGPVEVAVSADTTYRIVVGAQDQFPGDYKLSWSVGPPANDNVADAPQLAGQSTVLFPDVVRGSSLGATKEPGEPDHAGEPGGHSVWWKWAPWQGGEQISFDTVGSSFATVLAVYTRSADGTLTPVAADNGSAGGGASRVTFAAAYNVEYYVAVDGVDGASGAVTLRFYVPPPVNDNFADATDLGSAPSGQVTGTNSGATLEPGEPNIQGSGPNAQQSVWWRWTAPSNGWFAFDIHTSSHPGTTGTAAFYPVMQVYEGTAVDALTRVPDYLGGTTVGITAVAGHVYDIAVANSAVSPNGFGTIVLRWAAQPANDDFANSTDLGTATSGQVSGITIAATGEAGQPQPFTENSASNHYTVWYSWTAPSDGSLTLSTAGSQSAEVAVYTGDTLDTLKLQGAQNFFPAPGPISVAVTAGTVLRIMVGGEDGEPGDYKLSWSLGAPANDNVADAPQLAGQSTVLFPDVVRGSSLGATKEPGEPDHAGEPGGHSVWWKWAPWHGGERISFDTVGSSFATVLAVYTRSADGTLSPVAADNGSAGGGASRVSFAAAYNVEYYVAVDGVDGASGAVTLRYFVPPPVNDNFADATDLGSAPSGQVTGMNSGATLEPGEPNHQGIGQNAQKSVWWRWTAPSDGRFAFDVSASTSPGAPGTAPFYPIAQVYEGTAVDALTRVPPTYGGDTIGFDAVAGHSYDIAVANSAVSQDGFGTIVLRWSSPPVNDDFAAATTLTDASGTVTGSTVGATDEPGEPQPFTDGSASNYYTVWYAWSAPADGSLTLDTAGSQSASVAAFSGDSFGSLTLLGAQSIYLRDPLTFEVTQGTTYRFDIGGENQNPGGYQLAWQFTQANTPVANPVSMTTVENSPATLTFDAADDNGDPLTYSVDTPPSHGTLSAVTNGQVIYTPNANFSGADSFTYTASNGDLTSAPATVTITVTPVNHPPVCSSFAATTSENIAVNLFANCTDVDRDPLSIIVVGQPQHGSVSSFGSTLRYTPSPNYTGPDAFLYLASDGKSTSAVVSASITVNRIDQPPQAFSTSITTDEDTVATVALSASDPDGDPLTLTISSPPSHGSLGAISAGHVTYTPDPNFNGTDSFSYAANDGSLTSAPATVQITVTPVNDPPVAQSVSVTTAEDTEATVGLSASDPDGDASTLTVTSPPSHGSLGAISAGHVTYTPDPNFNGTDSFAYTASDGSATSAPATVAITVTPVNDAPVAQSVSVMTVEDTAAAVGLSASDVDGDALTLTITSPPAHGTLAAISAGRVTYTPDPDFNGTDSFAYTASDGSETSTAAKVSLTVTPVNDAPVAQSVSVTMAEDTAAAVGLSASDVDGDALTLTITSPPSHGSLGAISAGHVTYTPDPNFNGTDSFSYTASDGSATSTPATVGLTVTTVNDPPVTQALWVTTAEDAALAIGLGGSDVDGDPLTLTISSPPSHGTLSAVSAGQVTYTPGPNFNGTDSFSYTANDGALTSTPATVAITVTPVNDAPVAQSVSVMTAEDTAAAVGLSASDVDGDALTLTITSPPAHGTLAAISAGHVTYTPDPDFNGTDSFAYTASDGSETSTPAKVSLTVTPVNDAPVAGGDSAATTSGESVSIDVLANDADVDGDPLSITSSTSAGYGTASCSSTSCSYVAADGFTGLDSFTYSTSDGQGGSATATVTISVDPPPLTAHVGQPINADGSSVFKAGRGVVPVKFTVYSDGVQTCATKAATITLSRVGNGISQTVDEGSYNLAADSGTSFRISDCQYVYNLSLKQLPPGTYEAAIIIDGRGAGAGRFGLT